VLCPLRNVALLVVKNPILLAIAAGLL